MACNVNSGHILHSFCHDHGSIPWSPSVFPCCAFPCVPDALCFSAISSSLHLLCTQAPHVYRSPSVYLLITALQWLIARSLSQGQGLLLSIFKFRFSCASGSPTRMSACRQTLCHHTNLCQLQFPPRSAVTLPHTLPSGPHSLTIPLLLSLVAKRKLCVLHLGQFGGLLQIHA